MFDRRSSPRVAGFVLALAVLSPWLPRSAPVALAASSSSIVAPTAAAPSAAGEPSDTLPVPRVTVSEAMTSAATDSIALVDLRPTAQRALGHIAGDLSIPIDQLVARRSEIPANRRIVFYCSCPAEELALDAARYMMRKGNARVAALVGGYDAWRAAGGPVTVDASWEEIFRVADPPVGWGKTPVSGDRCRYALDDSVAYGGRSSGRIACRPDSNALGFAGFTQRLEVGEFRGRSVTLVAMAKSEGVQRDAFLWVAAEDAQGRMIPVTPPNGDPIAGTSDWRLVQVEGVVPPVAVRLVIGLSLTSAGRVWLDDVRLFTDQGPGLPRIRAVIQNHGFEP